MNPILIIIFILLFTLFILSRFVTQDGNNYFTAILSLIIKLTITCLLLIGLVLELVDWLLDKKVGTDLKNLIIVISIFLAFGMILLFVAWKTRIKNCIYIPLDYNKNCVLIIFNQKNAEFINAHYGFIRKRKIRLGDNGMLKVKNSRETLRSFRGLTEVRYRNGQKFNAHEGKYIYVEKYDFCGNQCDLVVFNVNSNIYSESILFSFPEEDIVTYINE